MTNTIQADYFLSTEVEKSDLKPNDILGKDDFLKILMVQLQNQDPLNPMEDKDFIAQMATFSSLEQLTNINKTLEQMAQATAQTSLVSYSEFVGKEVTWHRIVESDDPLAKPDVIEGQGTITSVQFLGDEVKFTLDDGTTLVPANISEVHQSSNNNQLMQASYLIGKTVTWTDDEGQEQIAAVQSVSTKGGQVSVHLPNEVVIRANQITRVK